MSLGPGTRVHWDVRWKWTQAHAGAWDDVCHRCSTLSRLRRRVLASTCMPAAAAVAAAAALCVCVRVCALAPATCAYPTRTVPALPERRSTVPPAPFP